jgi:acetylornithine/N-succinyldiaminopimelate aminotransferase
MALEIKESVALTSIDLVKLAMEEGLLLAPAGPKVLRFVPPLIVSEAEIDQAIAILDRAIAKYEG